jgi:hypothetical protein
MPINPNIALGAQQQQPVNMLGQMGQALALKAASQDIQGNEALREFYAQGGDTSTSEGRRQLMARTGAIGSKIIGQQSEISARDVKTQADSLKAIKDNVSLVNSPEGMVEFLRGAYSTPGGALLAKLAPLDKAIAAIPTDPKAFADYKRNLGLTSDKLFESADAQLSSRTSLATTGMTTAATRRGQDLIDKRAREELQYLQGENGFFGVNKFDPNSARYVGMMPQTGAPAAAPTAQPSAVNNLMMTTQPTPSVNALTQPASNQAGPTVAAANALNQQPTIIKPYRAEVAPSLTEVDDPANPGQKLKVDARVYKQGGTLGDPGVLGVARTEKLTPQQTLKLKTEMGKEFENVQRVVGQTNELLESIDAVRNSNLESVTGQFDARTPSFSKEAQIAETRFNNLKGKVTAIAKANASLGGAIGSIANQEWQILANQIAVLERTGGKTANLEQIDQLERQALGIVNRMRDGFERRFGENLDDLAPQYKDIPNVNYTPGQYTATGKKTSSVDSANPWLK